MSEKEGYNKACEDMADNICLSAFVNRGWSLDDAVKLVIQVRGIVYEVRDRYESRNSEEG